MDTINYYYIVKINLLKNSQSNIPNGGFWLLFTSFYHIKASSPWVSWAFPRAFPHPRRDPCLQPWQRRSCSSPGPSLPWGSVVPAERHRVGPGMMDITQSLIIWISIIRDIYKCLTTISGRYHVCSCRNIIDSYRHVNDIQSPWLFLPGATSALSLKPDALQEPLWPLRLQGDPG